MSVLRRACRSAVYFSSEEPSDDTLITRGMKAVHGSVVGRRFASLPCGMTQQATLSIADPWCDADPAPGKFSRRLAHGRVLGGGVAGPSLVHGEFPAQAEAEAAEGHAIPQRGPSSASWFPVALRRAVSPADAAQHLTYPPWRSCQ